MDSITISFIFYLTLILGIGLYSSRKTKSLNDFALGGQKLGPTVIAFSERASGESSWLILGLPGAALILGASTYIGVRQAKKKKDELNTNTNINI